MDKLKPLLTENWPTLLLFAVVASAFLLLRSKPSDLADASAFDAVTTAGDPTIVEFYSNF